MLKFCDVWLSAHNLLRKLNLSLNPICFNISVCALSTALAVIDKRVCSFHFWIFAALKIMTSNKIGKLAIKAKGCISHSHFFLLCNVRLNDAKWAKQSFFIKMPIAIHLKIQRLIYLPALMKLSGGLSLLTNNLFLWSQRFQTKVFCLNKNLCNSVHSVLGLVNMHCWISCLFKCYML